MFNTIRLKQLIQSSTMPIFWRERDNVEDLDRLVAVSFHFAHVFIAEPVGPMQFPLSTSFSLFWLQDTLLASRRIASSPRNLSIQSTSELWSLPRIAVTIDSKLPVAISIQSSRFQRLYLSITERVTTYASFDHASWTAASAVMTS